ncbi:hypothetical protein CSAL01_00764 [Colletotrichum salicis]|uniref:Zn(2)-C6 fungal-type domain-containing protein n=1 Tax=Colletotrichum salicis TaxID=1209931 RepID=A0A135RVS5_9PEZI|nr:hypothetical protein CSAL01_00764 [Colletotrichum salicis]
MTEATGVRQYRACVRCRARKTRIGENGKPPCAKCVREGEQNVHLLALDAGETSHNTGVPKDNGETAISQAQPRQHQQPALLLQKLQQRPPRAREEPLHRSLQNPSDALLILARAAEDEDGEGPALDNPAGSTPGNVSSVLGSILSPVQQTRQDPFLLFGSPVNPATIERDIGDYPPAKNGALKAPLLHHLLQHYAINYHCYFPIVPANVLFPQYLHETIKHESFLLTAALVVVSRDRPDLTELHQSIWAHMRHLILDVVLEMSTIRSVGCVEGLLLPGEWTPLLLGQSDDGGEGAAWSITKRLTPRCSEGVWLGHVSRFLLYKKSPSHKVRSVTYLSDRQISIRMGQAFWSRGPALSAPFTAEDFPSLQPQYASGDDFASLLQAQVELTTFFGNAHDILFASKQRIAELMVRGDYTKYIDDASRAIGAWDLVWIRLTAPSHLKCCLRMMEKYLRLYVNAFAFQAVLYRASLSITDVSRVSCFPHSAMASPDARMVYEAVDAAEALLKIAIEDIDPERHLRFMPARFYL